ncbi:MAG: hypothetical protein JST01_09850, partial [Cyanobacteria bacterium SZAS TMP-1]|nr:hypothetical protein [Cyanobacteria bacterium SZAS TMP-1]
ATIPPVNGKDAATIAVNTDHSSDLQLNGKDTHVDPDHPKNLVSEYNINNDGTIDWSKPLWNFNGVDDSFCTPDFSWDSDGTASLGWADFDISSEGSISSHSSGSTLYEPTKYESSTASAHAATSQADTAVASVSSKIGAQSISSSDIADLYAASGSLDAALAQAMSSGNFAAACAVINAKGEVAGMISEASQQVALAETMRSANLSEGMIVGAADDVASMGVEGAAAKADVAVNGQYATTAAGQEYYLAHFPTVHLVGDQDERLTA